MMDRSRPKKPFRATPRDIQITTGTRTSIIHHYAAGVQADSVFQKLILPMQGQLTNITIVAEGATPQSPKRIEVIKESGNTTRKTEIELTSRILLSPAKVEVKRGDLLTIKAVDAIDELAFSAQLTETADA